jgi:hypothetical protein
MTSTPNGAPDPTLWPMPSTGDEAKNALCYQLMACLITAQDPCCDLCSEDGSLVTEKAPFQFLVVPGSTLWNQWSTEQLLESLGFLEYHLHLRVTYTHEGFHVAINRGDD